MIEEEPAIVPHATRADGPGATTLRWPTVLAVLFVLVGALALRLVGIGFGRPYVYHPDEWAVAKPALGMVERGDWSPGLYIYPSALPYAERLLVSGIHLATGAPLEMTGGVGVAGLPKLGEQNFLTSQFRYVLAGRILVAVLGALTALLVYLAARRLTSTAGALVASGAIAVMPLNVSQSHFLATDVPTGAATALTLWLALEARSRGWRWLVLAGFAAGVAASTKYNGGLVLMVPVVVALAQRPVPWRTLALIVAAAAVGFIALTPAILFDTRAVLDAIGLQAMVYMRGHAGAEGDAAGYYLAVLLGDGMGATLAALAISGLAVAVVRRGSGELAVAAFTAAYFVLISLAVVRFSRNLQPMLPFLAVLAGVAVGALVTGVATAPRLAATGAIVVFALVHAGSIAVANDLRFLRPDTRTLALEWILANIPRGSVILREDFTPQVPPGPYEVGFAGILSNYTLEHYREIGASYLVASSSEFERFTVEGSWQRTFYEQLLAMKIIYDERATNATTGPRIVIVELGP